MRLRKNTNSVYVYQDGKVYYRRYNEDSYENAALWGNYDFYPIPETKKEIVCVDADGVETVLFEDEGYGDIYLVNNRFYMTDVFTLLTQKEIFVLEMWEDITVYYIMNYETGEKKRLFPDSPVSKLCAVSIEGEQREIIGIISSPPYGGYIIDAEVDEERAYFIFGTYAGSGVDFQVGLLISVKLDGTDYKAVWTEDDTFYLCHDKGKALVYFPRHYNGLFGGDDRPEYDALVWDVEADICYRSDFPTNVLYYYDVRTGLMWRYCSADMGALCSITISDDELQRKKRKFMRYRMIPVRLSGS